MQVTGGPGLLPIALVAALAAGGAACGGSGSSPSPPTATTTITITSAGAAPRAVTVSRGSQVTFVNNDSRTHDMVSDPHPEHTDCPEINSVGPLNPGQGRQTSNLNTARSCGFHDHGDADNQSLRGTITIQ
jgi:plastocyanin